MTVTSEKSVQFMLYVLYKRLVNYISGLHSFFFYNMSILQIYFILMFTEKCKISYIFVLMCP